MPDSPHTKTDDVILLYWHALTIMGWDDFSPLKAQCIFPILKKDPIPPLCQTPETLLVWFFSMISPPESDPFCTQTSDILFELVMHRLDYMAFHKKLILQALLKAEVWIWPKITAHTVTYFIQNLKKNATFQGKPLVIITFIAICLCMANAYVFSLWLSDQGEERILASLDRMINMIIKGFNL